MAIVFTYIARVKDWKRLQVVTGEALINLAKTAGARRYQVYRNVCDAAETLIVAEFADQEGARELNKVLNEKLDLLLIGGLADNRTWEPTGWEGVWQANAVNDN